MFESILEKVLNKFLAQYVDGLDKENLSVGIWSGDVEVKNVTLKSDILLMLELPLIIKFSHIGNLKLKVPWKSLGSSPVEATLSDVFIIISAQNPDQWVFQDYAGLKKKEELIEQFKEQLIKKIAEKQSSKDSKDDKDAGYVQKLVLKIIDNIQIEIKNIHIRFEDTITNQYSWGIALNKIEVFTTDKDWNKQYFDRTKDENKNQPVQKLLKLSNLGAYWIQKESSFFHSLPKEQVLEKMREIIITADNPNPSSHKFYNQYVLLLNLQAKLFQNRKGDFTKPEFIFDLDLQTINLSLENLQLQQIIRLAEMFTVYQNKLNQKKKQKLALQGDQIVKFINDFQVYFNKFYKSGKPTPEKALTQEELKLYEEAVINLSLDQLFDEVKVIVKENQKELMIKEAEKKKQESQKGWFGGWIGGKKKEEDSLLDDDTKNKLISLVDSVLEGDQQIQEVQRPPEYVWLEVHFILHGGFFHLTKLLENQRVGVQMYYNDFGGQIMVMDASTVIKMGLKKIAIDLTTELVEKGLVVKEIGRKAFLETVEEKFLDFEFATNPLNRKGVDKLIKLQTKSVQVTYNPLLVVRLQQFADLKVTNDDLKSAAWDQVEQVQDATAEKMQLQQTQIASNVLQIDIQCAAPIILLPFGNNEVWLINLGELKVKTPEKQKNQGFDSFEIHLDKLTFKYFNNQDYCIQMINQKNHLGQMEVKDGQLISYSVIQNFDISVEALILKNKKAPKEVPQLQVTGFLPKLDLCLQPSIYEKLVKVGDCFAPPPIENEAEKEKDKQSKVETDRTELMKKSTKVGKLWKKSVIGTWNQYNAVLSEGYIYFFAKPKDTQPESWVWIKNSDFTDLDEAKAGIANAFLVKNKYAEIELATDKPNIATQWKDAIEKTRTQPRKKAKEEHQVVEQVKEEPRIMKFGFELVGLSLQLQDDQNVEWMRLAIEGLGTTVIIDDGLIDCELKLKSLNVLDSIHNYLNPFFTYVITSRENEFSDVERSQSFEILDPSLIIIKIILINEKDKRYKKVNMDIDVTFGTLQAILKPLTIAKLLAFVSPQKKEEKELTFEEQQKIARETAKKQIVEQSEQQKVALNSKTDVIMMRARVKLNSIKATLVHRFTYLPLAEMNLQTTQIEFIKYIDEINLNGSLGNLQLIDLTNYPDTLSEEKDFVKIRPKQMIGVKDCSQSLLSIKLILLSEGSTKIKNDNINLFLDVKMSQLIINFLMQPTMRILDYLLSQLLFALSNPNQTIDPEYGVQKLEQIEKLEQSAILIQSAILPEEAMEILKKQLDNPPVMFINISIENPQVILKPHFSSRTSLIIDLGHIQVSNKRYKSIERCLEIDGGVWVDTYMVVMKNLEMYWGSEDKSVKREVTMKFDFNVSVEMFPMATQYSLYYPNSKLDQAMKIFTFMAPMIIQLTHVDYMFIMKCLFHNISYDDGFDTMIREKYPIYFKAFLEQQRMNEERQKRLLETGDESPAMFFQLDAENLTTFLLDDQYIPFIRMTLVMLRVQFVKRNNGNTQLILVTREMEGSVFKPLSDDLFQELPFLGPMNLKGEYSKVQITNLQGLVQGKSFSTVSKAGTSLALAARGQLTDADNRSNIFKFEDAEQHRDNNPKYKLDVELSLPLNKKMEINIILADFKVMLHAGPLMSVLSVIAMNDPDLTPAPGKFSKQQEIDQKQQEQPQGSMKIQLKLNNVVICAPTQVEQNVLAIRGEFNIGMFMGSQKKIQEVIEELKRQGIEPEIGKEYKEAEELNVTMDISLQLTKLEVCICKAYDLSRTEDFRLVKKREIVLPFDIILHLKRSFILAKDIRSFVDRTFIDAKLSKNSIKISFRDVEVIQVGIKYQLAQMPQQPEQQNEKIQEEKKDQNEKQQKEDLARKQLENLDKISAFDQKIDVQMSGLKILILNDIGNTFSPLLDFELLENTAKVLRNNVFTTVTLTVPFRLAYYNPRASMWEPVIEPTSFNIEYYTNQFGAKLGGTILTIEQNENFPFNITVSTMFIQILFKTLYLLKKMAQPQRQKAESIQIQVEEEKKQFEVQDEVFAHVSPYIVRNLTGCQLTVEPSVGDSLSKSQMVQLQKLPKITLKPNEQSNVQMTLDENEKIEISIQKKVNIGINIPSTKNQFVIKDIDMDRIKSKSHSQDLIKVFTNLKLDTVTNSKMLTVSSNVIFVNHTNEAIDLLIIDKGHESHWKLNFASEEGGLDHFAGVPIGLSKPRFSLKFNNHQQYSDEMMIEKIISRVNDQQQAQDDSKTLQVLTQDNRYVFLNVSQEKDSEGKFKINLEAPFKITNSLPKDIYIQLLNDQKETTDTLKLKQFTSYEDYKHSQFKRVYLRILLEGYYWSDEYNLCHEVGNNNVNTKKDCINELVMVDADSNEMSLLIYEPWKLETKGRGQREFIIHCTGYLMNQSPYQLTMFMAKDEKKVHPLKVPGQEAVAHKDRVNSNIIIFGPQQGQKLALSDASYKEGKSPNPASLSGIGSSQLDLLTKKDDKVQQIFMGTYVSIKNCNNLHTLLNKVVSIEPRFLLINQTTKLLMIKPRDEKDGFEIEPNKRIPYYQLYHEQNDFRRQIVNFNFDKKENYQWSGEIDISSIGIVYFQLRHQDEYNKRAYFCVDTREEGCNIFVIITQLERENAPYKLINRSTDVELKIFRKDKDGAEEQIALLPAKNYQSDEDQVDYYAWDQPCSGDKQLLLLATVNNNRPYKKKNYVFKPDHIGMFKVHTFSANQLPNISVSFTITANGFQKVILFENATKEQIQRSKYKTKHEFIQQAIQKQRGDTLQEDEEEKEQSSQRSQSRTSTTGDVELDNKIALKINHLTVSLVHNADHKKRPAEYLLMTIKNIELLQISSEINQTTQLRVQYFNVDHNSIFFVNHPVIMTPLKHQQYLKDKYFINILMNKDTNVKDIQLFQSISIEFDPFVVKVEQLLIQALMEFIGSMQTFKQKVEEFEIKQEKMKRVNSSRTQSQSVAADEEEKKQIIFNEHEENRIQKLHWYISELPPPSLPTYINELVVAPIEIHLTFQMQSKGTDFTSDDMAVFKSIAQALGVALSNIDEAPLKFTGLNLTDCFDTTAGITNKMVQFYKNEGMSQILKLLGSLSVLGNPVGLFNNITTGMKDLIDKPKEGFTKGPLEGGYGIVQGAGSLVTHTIAGAFNSINKITGSVSSGLSNLTMDEDYIREREKMRANKPKHIGQGLEQAGTSLVTGITSGISGVFLKPFEGAKKGGVKGFFKGTLQGLSGLVIKPVTGILDAAAKTTEGIKNTVQYWDDKPNENRERNIRPIYGPEGFYKDYIDFDAESYTTMNLIKKGEFMNNRFMGAFLIVPDLNDKDNSFLFILTLENIMYLSFKSKKKVWIISVKNFANVDVTPTGVRIITKQPLKALKVLLQDKKEAIIIAPKEQKEQIFESIQQMIELVKYLN